MTHVITQPAGSASSREHYQDTIDNPVDIDKFQTELGAFYEELADVYPSRQVPMWGVTSGGSNLSKFGRVGVGDVVVFGRARRIYAVATVALTFQNQALATGLWGVDENGKTWENMYALDEVRPADLSYRDFAEAVGYEPNWILQGFNVLDEDKSGAALATFDFFSDKHAPTKTQAEYDSEVRAFEEGVDRTAQAQQRREQGHLKNVLIPSTTATCDLCGALLPRQFLIAAHIKKRAVCSFEEKIDIPNIAMAACVFGCDHLYERGYITVAEDGTLRVTDALHEAGEVVGDRLDALHGRRFGRDYAPRAKYFAWHRSNTFRGRTGMA